MYLFLLHKCCFWGGLQIQCNPDQHDMLPHDEWMNEYMKGI